MREVYSMYSRPATMYIHNQTPHTMYYISNDYSYGSLVNYSKVIPANSIGKIFVAEYSIYGPEGSIKYSLVYDEVSLPVKYVLIDFYWDHPMTARSSHYSAKVSNPNIAKAVVDNPTPSGHSQTVNFTITMTRPTSNYMYY